MNADYKVDLLVLGMGAAAQLAAIYAHDADPDLNILIATKALKGKGGCSRMVQGGFNVVLDPGDSHEKHLMDTLKGGQYINDQDLALALVEQATPTVKELETVCGCFFDRRPDGHIHQKAFAGQCFDRTVHKGDLTGIEIISRTTEQVFKRRIPVLEETRAVELLLDAEGTTVTGALLYNMRTGAFITVEAAATLVATGGTVAGVVIAGISATIFSMATGITGWNVSDIESLLTLSSTSGVQVGGLLFSGLLISSLGAVMDVAMSIGSAIAEIHAQNPALSRGELFKAGMHVGRDMMGTDSNTLILAFAGGSVSMLLLDYAYDLPYYQIINSNNIGIAVMQGLSGSFGVVLSVPVTVVLATALYTFRRQPAEAVPASASAPL